MSQSSSEGTGGRAVQAAPASLSAVLATGAIAGLIGGAASALIDGLWSIGDAGQFLPSAGSKVAYLLSLVMSYGLAFGAFGLCAAGLFLTLSRYSRVGEFLRFALRTHQQWAAEAPRRALVGLSLVLAGAPLMGACFGGAYWYAFRALAARNHPGLVIASAMGIALGAAFVGMVLTLIAARPIESLLAKLCDKPALARALSSLYAPLVAMGLLALVGGGAATLFFWKTLSLLPLRPLWVGLLGAALVAGILPAARGLAGRWDEAPPLVRRGSAVLLPLLLFVLVLVTGASQSVIKAQVAYSGLAPSFARGYRALGDWDRDGYSKWLGGGDCDDMNAAVNPAAAEIPDDGVDNNCVGGDVTLAHDPSEAAFSALPSSLPPDFNVVLITIDTIRADHLGAYGYQRKTTPHLDALAADGSLFVNAWAHAPSTRYSIPALLTGRYPLNVRYTQIPNQWPGLSTDNRTIAEVLSEAGFYTGAILNYWYFDAHRMMNQGFRHYDNQNKRLHKAMRGQGPAKTSGSSSKEQSDKSIEFINAHKGQRFFLWTHYYDPHYDYEQHPGIERFGSAKIDQYDHEIAYTDKHIGRVFDELKRQGLWDKTVVIVTGDHGEGFGEHGIDLHGYHLYAAQTKVPLIMRVPGSTPTRIEMPASHVDVLPTLANLVGQEPHPDMMGRSLLGVISGSDDASKDRWVFQQLSYENNNEYRAAASKECHVLFNVSPNMSWELYRIDEDPMEKRDIIDAPGRCAQARSVLEAWYDRSEIPEGASEALLASPPQVTNPLGLRFGSKLELLEARMPPTVKRGESFELELTWKAHGTPPAGWRIFAHFEGSGSRFMGDHEPARPFPWWRKGQFIRYRHTVTVPKKNKTGKHSLWLGLFKGNERMEIQGASLPHRDSRAQLGSIEVLP